MSHSGLSKFEALLETLVQVIDDGQDWQHLRPLIKRALQCFSPTVSIQLWIETREPGSVAYCQFQDERQSPDGSCVFSQALPADAVRSLAESRVIGVQGIEEGALSPEISLFVPRRVVLPVSGSDAGSQNCQFVLGIHWTDHGTDASLSTDDSRARTAVASTTLPESRRVIEPASLAVADCLTGFVLRWLLANATRQTVAQVNSTPRSSEEQTGDEVTSFIAASLMRQLSLSPALQNWCDNVTVLGVSWLRDGRVSLLEVVSNSNRAESLAESPVRVLSVNGIGVARRENRTVREIRYWFRQIRNGSTFSRWLATPELRQADFVMSSSDGDAVSTMVRCEEVGKLSENRVLFVVLECLRESLPPEENELQQILAVIRSTVAKIAGRELQRMHRRTNRLWLSAGGLLAFAIWLCLPTSFELEVDGQVFPQQRRRIFAPENAIVDTLFVQENETVAFGADLVLLRSPELDLEFSRLEGEIAAVETRVRTLRALRTVSPQGDSAAMRRDGIDLSTEEQQAVAELKSLQEQLKLIESRRKSLRIAAPLAGTVHRRRSNLDLEARPVNRGQVLMEIGDASESARWVAVLSIPDSMSGYLRTAFIDVENGKRTDTAKSLPVEFSTVGGNRTRYQATLTEWSAVTDFDGGTLNREGVAEVLPADGKSFRSGMRVRARIQCGHRSRGFVWFREFVEFLQRKSFAWF